MGATKNTPSDVLHLSIIKGSLMQKSDKSNPEAVERKYEDKDGNEKSKWEVVFSKVSGMITNVEFKDGDFGEQVLIDVEDVGEKVRIYMPSDSRYFTDFAKKLPNIDLAQDVELLPYDFTGDNGKPVKGMSVKQNDEKIYSFYYDSDKKKTINGLPQPDKNANVKGHDDAYDKDDWKIFFMKEKKYLKKKVQGTEFGVAPTPKENIKEEEHDDVPF